MARGAGWPPRHRGFNNETFNNYHLKLVEINAQARHVLSAASASSICCQKYETRVCHKEVAEQVRHEKSALFIIAAKIKADFAFEYYYRVSANIIT